MILTSHHLIIFSITQRKKKANQTEVSKVPYNFQFRM